MSQDSLRCVRRTDLPFEQREPVRDDREPIARADDLLASSKEFHRYVAPAPGSTDRGHRPR